MYYVAEKSQNDALINKLELIIAVPDAGEESVVGTERNGVWLVGGDG